MRARGMGVHHGRTNSPLSDEQGFFTHVSESTQRDPNSFSSDTNSATCLARDQGTSILGVD